jgi:predicted proteasome-type protease
MIRVRKRSHLVLKDSMRIKDKEPMIKKDVYMDKIKEDFQYKINECLSRLNKMNFNNNDKVRNIKINRMR